MSVKRRIRRSHAISPFGVGAIYDFGDESLVAMGTFHWKTYGEVIRLPRLEEALKVQQFRMPPVPRGNFDPHPPTLPFMRFPTWLFCPKCRLMVKLRTKDEVAGEAPCCGDCAKQHKKVRLVPMRFVMVCVNGHLDDIPWEDWAHEHSKNNCRDNNHLYFETIGGGTGGLESLKIRCKTCGSINILEGLSSKDSLKRIGFSENGGKSCRGKQPWETHAEGSACREIPQVAQRGASNVYYPHVASALDIECDSDREIIDEVDAQIKNHSMYPALKNIFDSQTNPESDQAILSVADLIARQVGCQADKVIKALKGEEDTKTTSSQSPKWPDDIMAAEYSAFLSPPQNSRPKDPFIAETVFDGGILPEVYGMEAGFSAKLSKLISKIVVAHRLREVRALCGFSRYKPEMDKAVRPDLGHNLSWLPAIEVFGEGIFISFSEDMLADWERKNRQKLAIRLQGVQERLGNSNMAFLPEASPRFIMLHTLSHILMRQLAFECGYSSSSLRERIYCSSSKSPKGAQSAILIYTADSDSEGSLGGLARQGSPERFVSTLTSSLNKSIWCSSDPICSELPGQGLHGLNMAACHACTLVSETSCTFCNLLLDRAMLTGLPGGDNFGFFNDLGL